MIRRKSLAVLQGYDLGAFDCAEVRARRGEGTPSGLVLLRFPLPWRRNTP
jgi:hypothetical protein